MKRTARCSCGQISVTVEGEPFEVWACHCLECQRQAGTPYSLTAGWEDASVVARTGEAQSWARQSYRDRRIENFFCPVCGSTVYSRSEAVPGVTMVAVGNFADPQFLAPTVEYWTEHRHRWVEVPSAHVHWKRQAEDVEEG
jgi:hypothetical protein